MRHVITLQPPFDGTAIFICCSCSDEPIAKVGFPEAAASLVEINEIAHTHIERAEQFENFREMTDRAVTNWPMSAAHAEAIRPAPRNEPCTLVPVFDPSIPASGGWRHGFKHPG